MFHIVKNKSNTHRFKLAIALTGFGLIAATLMWFVRYPMVGYFFMVNLGIPSEVVGEIYKNNAIIQYKLGSRHLGGGGEYDLRLAEKFIAQAIMLNEQLPYAHYQQARLHFLDSRYAKALTEVNKELEYNPTFSRSYYLRGLINGYDGQYSDAVLDFTEFIKREPEEWAGYADRAWVLFQLGDYQGVRETMESILPRTKNAWLLNAYGVALLNLDEYEMAHEALLEARDLASRMTPDMWGIAYIGNDPRIYGAGLEEMKKNIDENLVRVNNTLSEK